MSRYSFQELRRRPKDQDLPADINEPIRELAGRNRFDCPELVEMIDRIEDKKLYGKIIVRNAWDQEVAVINMQYGICDRYTFVHQQGSNPLCKPFSVEFMRSVINEKVDMGKRKEAES